MDEEERREETRRGEGEKEGEKNSGKFSREGGRGCRNEGKGVISLLLVARGREGKERTASASGETHSPLWEIREADKQAASATGKRLSSEAGGEGAVRSAGVMDYTMT